MTVELQRLQLLLHQVVVIISKHWWRREHPLLKLSVTQTKIRLERLQLLLHQVVVVHGEVTGKEHTGVISFYVHTKITAAMWTRASASCYLAPRAGCCCCCCVCCYCYGCNLQSAIVYISVVVCVIAICVCVFFCCVCVCVFCFYYGELQIERATSRSCIFPSSPPPPASRIQNSAWRLGLQLAQFHGAAPPQCLVPGAWR